MLNAFCWLCLTLELDMDRLKRALVKHRNLAVILSTFVVVLPICFLVKRKEVSCGFTFVIMSIFWLTACLPIGVTSLLPFVFFPIFGVAPSSKAARDYFQDVVLLFFGSLVLAKAIELTKLHERVSLTILAIFGTNPKLLMLKTMLITAFLSLWISNAAACSMSIPMVLEIVKQLITHDAVYHDKKGQINFALEADTTESIYTTDSKVNFDKMSDEASDEMSVEMKEEEDISLKKDSLICKSEKSRKLTTGFLLSCAYSSIIGGFGSLVGSPANSIFKSYIDDKYPDNQISFIVFSLFSFPVIVILIFLTWTWLTVKWLPREVSVCNSLKKKKEDSVREMINEKYRKLGRIEWDQICVMVLFALVVLLWLTRDIQGYFGWDALFDKHYISDATPSVLIIILLFLCPRKNIFRGEPYKNLLDWSQIQSSFPWDFLLILGGSLVLAEGFQESGLSNLIGQALKDLISVFSFGRKELALLIILVLGSAASELTSNACISFIFLPIVNSLALEMKIDPIFFLLPLTLAINAAYMLPLANLNNAFILGSGYLKMSDMIFSGLVIKIISVIVLYLNSQLFLAVLIDSSKLLPWSLPFKPTMLNGTNLWNMTSSNNGSFVPADMLEVIKSQNSNPALIDQNR